MILVIADDFTGAAELAGIAFDYGLKTEVQTTFNINPNLDLDVLVVDTNTRSKTSREAEQTIENIVRSIKKSDFKFIYKKTDSVFRGHIYSELKKLKEYFPQKSILLAPANPSQGRIITKGRYFINNQLLHKTHFAEDPESPQSTSEITGLMKANERADINIVKQFDEFSLQAGIIYIAETKDSDEMSFWAKYLKDNIIPAGGADFFEALLVSNGIQKGTGKVKDLNTISSDRIRLFICGSSLSSLANIGSKVFGNKPEVIEISKDWLFRKNAEDLTELVIERFKHTYNVILLINVRGNLSDLNTHKIPRLLADITFRVFKRIDLDEILVEGGTTSSEVVRRTGWDRFEPIEQIGPGVIRLKVVNSLSKYITVKPGSYEWPHDI